MKKIIENTDNIAYKFKIFDNNIKNVSIKPKEIIENYENQTITQNAIIQAHTTLNGKA